MLKLYKKHFPNESEKEDTNILHGSTVLNVLLRASQHGISDLLIERLNYYDLQNMILEYDIKIIRDHINQKQNKSFEETGRRKATNEEIIKFHA